MGNKEIALVRNTSGNLAKNVYASDFPEEYIKTIPAEALFLAIKKAGLSSSCDLIDIASLEQIRIVMDLDLWHRDTFLEENFWSWLALTDAQDSLEILQKILKVVDLKLIALLIGKYVEAVSFDNPTENPPSGDFFTPDLGYTWIRIDTTDSDRDFLLSRLLAMVFETSTDLFYQLLSIPGISTQTILEEEAYQDASKRMLAEGIPDMDMAVTVNIRISHAEVKNLLAGTASRQIIEDIQIIEPLVYDSSMVQPLQGLISSIKNKEEVETELTHLMNCAIIHWGIEISEYDEVLKLSNKVKGALNIGLELCMKISGLEASEVYKRIGLITMYRLGLTEVLSLKKTLSHLNESAIENMVHQEEEFGILAGLKENFPEVPNYFVNGKILSENGALLPGYRAFEYLSDLDAMKIYTSSKLLRITAN